MRHEVKVNGDERCSSEATIFHKPRYITCQNLLRLQNLEHIINNRARSSRQILAPHHRCYRLSCNHYQQSFSSESYTTSLISST